RRGTDEAAFTCILTQRSFAQIREIGKCYHQKLILPTCDASTVALPFGNCNRNLLEVTCVDVEFLVLGGAVFKHGKSLQKAVEKETSGYFEKTFVAIIQYAEDKNTLFAKWFYETMAGAGTRDNDLIRLVLVRSDLDLEDIKRTYLAKYKKTLAKAIEGDTSGDYRRMLVALVN
ncbi:unnamed protein product, partial [Dibothriocephalus latus]